MMEYRIFRFSFSEGVHLGDNSLEDYGICLRADTLFSALCLEALKNGGEEMLERIVSYAKSGHLLLSDAVPFIGDEYYLTKPVCNVQPDSNDTVQGSGKIFKKLKFIPLDMVDEYLSGEFDEKTADYITKKLDSKLGGSSVIARAAVRVPEDTLPYHVGVFSFMKDAGLYIFAGGDKEPLDVFRELLSSLSHSGIGGKRSSGLGRFSVEEEAVDEDIAAKIESKIPPYMTLSVSLPKNDEAELSLIDSTYTVIRRSGFVYSETYSSEPLRKNDLYVLGAGSIVRNKFVGDVYDVSNGGNHPVYRYAKPMFLGVGI